MVATVGDPAGPMSIHTSKIRDTALTSSWLSAGQGPTAPLSAYQYALTANFVLKLFKVVQMASSLFASD